MLDLLQTSPTAASVALDRLRALHRGWEAAGRTLLDELSDSFMPWVHYQGAATTGGGLQFFYHRHDDAPDGEGEHGHFHLFMSPAGMPAGLSPLVLPELAVAWSGARDTASCSGARGMAAAHAVPQSDLCHLVGIGVDGSGRPHRLFTTNRWVTGETWYVAADVIAMLDHAHLPGVTALERWLTAVLQAFRSDIHHLLRERDAAIAAWRLRRRSGHSHEDRRLVTPSSRAIGLSPGF